MEEGAFPDGVLLVRAGHAVLVEYRSPSLGVTQQNEGQKDLAVVSSFAVHVIKHLPQHQQQISKVVGRDVPLGSFLEGGVDWALGQVKKMLTSCASGSSFEDLSRAYQRMLDSSRASRQGFVTKITSRPSHREYKEVDIDFVAFDPRVFRGPGCLDSRLFAALLSIFEKDPNIEGFLFEVQLTCSPEAAAAATAPVPVAPAPVPAAAAAAPVPSAPVPAAGATAAAAAAAAAAAVPGAAGATAPVTWAAGTAATAAGAAAAAAGASSIAAAKITPGPAYVCG